MSPAGRPIALGRSRSRALLALATLTSSSSSSSSCRRTVAPAARGEASIESAGTWAGLRVRTVGERRNPQQVVILMHGWGAPGDDLVPLGEVLAAPGRLWVFPEAPLVSQGGGRAWWHLDLARIMEARERGQERDLRQETPVGLPEARAQMIALVAEVTRRSGVAPASVLIGGFSQGAMVATDVALLSSPGAVGGLVVMSGSLVAEATWTAHLQAMTPGFPIFMSHGRGRSDSAVSIRRGAARPRAGCPAQRDMGSVQWGPRNSAGRPGRGERFLGGAHSPGGSRTN